MFLGLLMQDNNTAGNTLKDKCQSSTMSNVVPGVTQIQIKGRSEALYGCPRTSSFWSLQHKNISFHVKMPLSKPLNLCLLRGSFAWLPLRFDLDGEYVCEHLRGIFEDPLLCCVYYDNWNQTNHGPSFTAFIASQTSTSLPLLQPQSFSLNLKSKQHAAI